MLVENTTNVPIRSPGILVRMHTTRKKNNNTQIPVRIIVSIRYFLRMSFGGVFMRRRKEFKNRKTAVNITKIPQENPVRKLPGYTNDMTRDIIKTIPIAPANDLRVFTLIIFEPA